MEKKKFQVFVVFHYESSSRLELPCFSPHECSLSDLMLMGLYLDEDAMLVEYVDNTRTRVVDVINGEYHERT